jgi:hypothetical protein
MYILYQCNREENGSEIIAPIVCSSKESVLEEYLNRLLKASEEYEVSYDKVMGAILENGSMPAELPRRPTPYLTREFFRIEPIKNLDE